MPSMRQQDRQLRHEAVTMQQVVQQVLLCTIDHRHTPVVTHPDLIVTIVITTVLHVMRSLGCMLRAAIMM